MEEIKKDRAKKDKVKIILVVAVSLLVLFIIWMFAIRPAIEKRDVKLANEAIQYAIVTLMQQAITCELVPLTFANQTINLIAIDCLQQQG